MDFEEQFKSQQKTTFLVTYEAVGATANVKHVDARWSCAVIRHQNTLGLHRQCVKNFIEVSVQCGSGTVEPLC